MTPPPGRPAPITTERFVREDLRTLAGYVDVALETLEQSLGAGTSERCDDALAVLRRVRWHLAATPPRLTGSALIAADQAAFAAPRRASFVKPRSVLTPDMLTALLAPSLPDAAALRIESVDQLLGGRSKLMAVVTQSGCASLPPRFVFRQDWASAVTGTSVRIEHGLMERIARAGIRTPAPLHLGLPDTPGDGPFILLELAAGRTAGDMFDPPADPALALALAAELGRLHAVPPEHFAGLPDLETRDHAPAALAPRIARFAATDGSLGQNSAVIAEALRRLPDLMPDGAGPLALVHGDLGFHNLLVEDGRLNAMLDWEFAHLGHPAEDLGYIRGDIERMMPWEDFLAAYHAAGGPVSAARDVDFYQTWGMVRLYCLLLQARGAVRAGLVRDVGVARMCAEWIPRLLETLDGAIQRLDA